MFSNLFGKKSKSNSNNNDDSVVQKVLVVVVVALVLYYFVTCVRDNKNKNNNNNNNNQQQVNDQYTNYENFEDHQNLHNNHDDVHENFDDHGNGDVNFEASEGVENNEVEAPVSEDNSNNNPNNLPAECYPKDVLESGDLLPNDADSKWAQTNPNGQGSLGDKNFLNAGFHVGVNTVGQSLRNANRQLRSDPPNPQVKVSPWMQTTIEPDINRKAMEIA